MGAVIPLMRLSDAVNTASWAASEFTMAFALACASLENKQAYLRVHLIK
jgi:hypothetical protein